MEKTILATEPLHPMLKDLLSKGARVVEASSTAPEVLAREVRGVDGVVVRLCKFTADLMAAGDRLKVIGRTGVGLDNIDVDAATARGVPVVFTPDAVTISVAEHVLGSALALAKRYTHLDRETRAGNWAARNGLGRDLHGCTFGFVGLGRIGAIAARKCRAALDADIVVFDPYIRQSVLSELGATLVESLDELLRRSDVVSLHVPLTPETRGLIGARELATMKPTAYLIHAARGSVVDERALADALREGTIAGAAVDVFEREPPGPENPLFGLPNALLTPHTAGLTEESQERVARTLAADVLAVLGGRMPRFPANPQVLRSDLEQ